MCDCIECIGDQPESNEQQVFKIPDFLRNQENLARERDAETRYKDGEPCSHPGCLRHVSRPCEGCGRIAGRYADKTPNAGIHLPRSGPVE